MNYLQNKPIQKGGNGNLKFKILNRKSKILLLLWGWLGGECFYFYFSEVVVVLAESAENRPARVHYFELFTVGIFNFDCFFVIFDGDIGFAEFFGDFGCFDSQPS